MRKLLSLMTLCCVMVIGAGVSVSCASAATLTNAIHSLKVEHTSVVERADYYRDYWHPWHHRRYWHPWHHRHYWHPWRHRHYWHNWHQRYYY